MKNLKVKSQKKSRIYIDENGNLIKQYTQIEKFGIRLIKSFKALPFLISFLLFALIVIELCCFFGLLQVIAKHGNIGDIGIYAFLMCIIGLLLMIGIGIGWSLSEEQQQVANSPQIIKPYSKDKLNDYLEN